MFCVVGFIVDVCIGVWLFGVGGFYNLVDILSMSKSIASLGIDFFLVGC